jgi:diguanylate cyclase (GGDEF)-like protein
MNAVERHAIFTDLRRRTVESTPTSSLAAMFVAGTVALVLSAIFPLSHSAPVGLYDVGAVICAAAAPIIFFIGARREAAVLPVGILGGIALLGIIVATAKTDDGTALCAFAFQWLAVYLAYCLPWRTAAGYMAVAMITLNVALINNSTHWERHARAVITVSLIAIFILLARLVHQLRVQATTDQLTGLLNRTGLIEAARIGVAKALRQGQRVTLCAIDLDDFKSVNDDAGHIGADRLLVELAARWRTVVGTRGIVARYGGDEFIMICFGLELAEIDALLEQMRDASPLKWSVGHAPLGHIDGLDASIQVADTMLYRQKAQRRTAGS